MPVDIRDIDKDFYRMEIVGDNELMLYVPSLPFQMQYDSAKRNAALNNCKLACERCQEAQEITVSEIELMASRKQKKLRLRFPEHICLGNLKSGIDNVIPLNAEPYWTSVKMGERKIKTLLCNVTWKVASVSTRRKAQGSAKKATNSYLSDIFDSMSIDDDE